VRSPYGLHLLWVEELQAARDATIDEVRSQVVEGRRSELREERLRAFLSELRTRYTVVVERPSDA
jgi:parvulin-like peptidyl-prolyl isomerase